MKINEGLTFTSDKDENEDEAEDKTTLAPLRYLDPEPCKFPLQEELETTNTSPIFSQSLLSVLASIAPSYGDKKATGGKSFIYYVTKIQKYSSYAFTIFASFHITNTSLIPFLTRSVSTSETYLLLTRPYYQTFPLEVLLVGLPIAIHVTAGITLRLYRRNTNLLRYGAKDLPIPVHLKKRLNTWPSLSWSSITGYLLIPIVGGHAFINRILPLLYEGGSSGVGLGFIAHSFAKHPLKASFGYLIMIGLASSHFCWGISRWNGLVISTNNRKFKQRNWCIHGISAALAAVWMIGGLGIVARGGRAEGWVGTGYDSLLQRIWL